MSLSTEGLARFAAKRPWPVIVISILLVVISGALYGTLFEDATTEGNGEFTTETESVTAQELLEQSGLREEQRDFEVVLIDHPTLSYDSAEFAAKINEVHAAIVDLGPETVYDPDAVPNPAFLPREAGLVSQDGTAVRIPVTLAGDFNDAGSTVVPLLELAEELNEGEFTVGVFGSGAIGAAFNEASETDLLVGEAIGGVAALIILIFLLRTFGSVWIPLVVAIFGILMAYGSISVIGQFYDNIPFFVSSFITMIGLAVGIDYTLFILARYREELARGSDKLDAIAFAGATASRAVLFSGATVVFALIGMLIVPTTIFFAMALGAILVVIYTVALSMLFLPAVLSLMGDKVNGLKAPFLSQQKSVDDAQGGVWNSITRTVLKQPVIFLVVTLALLIALTIPYFNITLGFNGIETLPEDFAARQAYETLESEFEGGTDEISPIDIVVSGDADSEGVRDGIERLIGLAQGEQVFRQASEYQVSDNNEVGVIVFQLQRVDSSDQIADFIRSLRDEHIPGADVPADVLVGGQRAFEVDFFDLVNRWTPIVLAVVLTLSFVLLTLVFRSLVVPVKAIILNLLSVGAAYGMLVLVFQEGFLSILFVDVFGYQQVSVIEAWIPLFLFAVLFGLSMDYEVFLLSRIRERYDRTGDNDESVAFGLRSTAAIITGAALIMVSVFFGFTKADLVMFQQMGFGLGIAILVDATIIRSILVPSTMKLLGHRNWWLPGFLNWLPDVRVEGGERP